MSQPGWQQQQPWQQQPQQPQPWQQQPQQPQQPLQPYGQSPQGQQLYGRPPGYPPQGHGRPRPKRAMVIATAVSLVPAALLTLVFAILLIAEALEGSMASHAVSSMIFLQVLNEPDQLNTVLSWNVIVPLVALVFAVAMLVRPELARWVVVALSGVAVVYFVFAIIKMLSDGAPGEFLLMPILALLLWALPGVLALLPATGGAARRPPMGQPPMPPMGPQQGGPQHGGPPQGYWQ